MLIECTSQSKGQQLFKEYVTEMLLIIDINII